MKEEETMRGKVHLPDKEQDGLKSKENHYTFTFDMYKPANCRVDSARNAREGERAEVNN